LQPTNIAVTLLALLVYPEKRSGDQPVARDVQYVMSVGLIVVAAVIGVTVFVLFGQPLSP
jgi:hypothetical protein